MGVLFRGDFSAGWQPSADKRQCPPNGFLRGDNLTLDEQGGLSLRAGSTLLTGITQLSGGAVDSLFTTVISGSRERYAGAGQIVHKSETVGVWDQILNRPGATGEWAFGAQLGQVFMAQGVETWKNDGSVAGTREWGLATPSSTTPGVSAIASNSREVSTFGNSESPAWGVISSQDGTIVSSGLGTDGVANGCRVVTPNQNTGKGTIRKVYGAPQDFLNFADGEGGVDEDLIEFYVWSSDPDNLEYLELAFDVNGDDSAASARFRDDYYYHEVTFDDATEVRRDKKAAVDGEYRVQGSERDRVVDSYEDRKPWRSRMDRTRGTSSGESNSGWAKFSIPRSKFFRVGNTSGKNWSTVIAIQYTFKYFVPEDAQAGTIDPGFVQLDDLKIIGGENHTLTGKYKVRCVLYADYGTHVVRSGPSEFSREIELKSNGLSVSFAIGSAFANHVIGAAGDPTVGVEAYLMGGTLNRFYRCGTVEQTNGIATITVTDSEVDMVVGNIQLEADLSPPPDNIIGVVDHRTRLFVLTSTNLNGSQRFNPESFPLKLNFPVGNRSFTAYWMRKRGDDIFVGTSIDIFILEGVGDEYPDGTTDYKLRALGVGEPPISEAAASDGGTLVYLASDGWRILKGTSSERFVGPLDLLYQGQTRYGVSPPNLGSSPGRYRAAIWSGRFYSTVPEGSSSGNTTVLHIYTFEPGNYWRRAVYTPGLTVIYREPDGKILAGDDLGRVYQLEVGGQTTDEIVSGGAVTQANIPYTFWSRFDDDKLALQKKQGFDIRLDLSSNQNVNAALYVDENESTVWQSWTALASDTALPHVKEVTTTNSRPISWQLRLTGSASSFRMNSWSIAYRECPLPRMFWDTGFMDLGMEWSWIRHLELMCRGKVNVRVKILYEGVVLQTTDVSIQSEVETIYPIPVGRFVRGRQPRITFDSSPFATTQNAVYELYWLRVTYRGSGTRTQKKIIKLSGS